MVSINLIPESVSLKRRKRKRLRRWSAVVIATACVVALPVGYDVIQTARASSLEKEVEPARTTLAQVRQSLSEEVERHKQLATQIARADALRSKRGWSDLFSAVAQYTPESVWLLSMETKDAQEVHTKRLAPSTETKGEGEDEGPVRLDGPSGMQLTGYALDHESLYVFMRELKRARVFESVELSRAGKEPVLEGLAVRFVLDCDW